MDKITYGTKPKNSEDMIKELYQEVGAEFPVNLLSENGKIVHITCETEWNEGGTKPIVDAETGEVTGYKASKKMKQLTDEQVKLVNEWIKNNAK